VLRPTSSLGDRLRFAVLPRLAYAYIRLLRRTMRIEYRQAEVLERVRREHGSYILAFWHSRFVLMPFAYPGGRIVVLASRHRDGRMIGEILRRFGLECAWGSSTTGGAGALRDILRRVRAGYDVGFTPDGPRGPRRRAKPGVVATARLGGLPIVPVAFSARPARRLRSWDRTLVPRLFARGLFVYGEPIPVDRDADAREQEAIRERVEAELDRLTDLADAGVGTPVEEARPPGRWNDPRAS
jgi:lysophospholipid acyltransferase (LPLAT)-like uncharacterized protein